MFHEATNFILSISITKPNALLILHGKERGMNYAITKIHPVALGVALGIIEGLPTAKGGTNELMNNLMSPITTVMGCIAMFTAPRS